MASLRTLRKRTLLHEKAAHGGLMRWALYLRAEGVCLDPEIFFQPDENGRTPVQEAAEHDHIDELLAILHYIPACEATRFLVEDDAAAQATRQAFVARFAQILLQVDTKRLILQDFLANRNGLTLLEQAELHAEGRMPFFVEKAPGMGR